MNPLGSRISRLEDSFSFGTRDSFYRVEEIGSGFHYPNFENDYRKDVGSISYSRASGATYRGSTGKVRGFAISTSTVGYGTGSRTWTVAAGAGVDMEFTAGENITATGQTNQLTLLGTVTSYNPTTQQLVCNITSYPAGTGGLSDSVWKLIRTSNPRIQCDTSGTPLGILIEPQSTNNCDPDTIVNVLANGISIGAATLTTDTPLGSNVTAWTRDLTVSATTATHSVRVLSKSYTGGGINYNMSFSLFAKKGTGRYLGLSLHITTTSSAACIFDLQDGTIGQTYTTTGGIINATRVESWGDGWYRIILEARINVGATGSILGRAFTAPAKTGNTFATTGMVSYLGVGETFKIALPQHEDVGYASSVIVGTSWTGAALTRNPDTVRYDSTKFTDWFFANGTGIGTFVIDFIPFQTAASNYVATTDVGLSFNAAVGIFDDYGNYAVVDADFNTSQYVLASSSLVQSMAFTTLDSNTVTTSKFAANGVMIDTEASLTSDVSNATVFSLGSLYNPSSGLYESYHSVIIKSIKWFDTILSDYEMRYYTGMRG